MNLTQAVVAVVILLSSLQLLVLLQQRGVLRHTRRRLKALELRTKALQIDVSKLPEDVVTDEDFAELKKSSVYSVSQLSARLDDLDGRFVSTSRHFNEKLITREGAERIVAQVNAVTLDVQALKDWQETIGKHAALKESLFPDIEG